MLRVPVNHEINCNPERFWNLYFDPDFTRTLIVEGLGFHRCEVGPLQETDQEIRRETTATPKLELPPAVVKVVGPRLSYREQGRFDKNRQVWTFNHILGVLPDKIKMGGEMRLEPIDGQRCRRAADLWVDVKIFGVGGLVDKAAEKNMRKGWDQSARWLNQWLAANPEAGT